MILTVQRGKRGMVDCDIYRPTQTHHATMLLSTAFIACTASSTMVPTSSAPASLKDRTHSCNKSQPYTCATCTAFFLLKARATPVTVRQAASRSAELGWMSRARSCANKALSTAAWRGPALTSLPDPAANCDAQNNVLRWIFDPTCSARCNA